MKFGLEGFAEKTPPIMRKIGYALYGAGMGAAALTFVPALEGICKWIAIATFAGGFLTQFFAEDKNNDGIPDNLQ